MGGRKKGTPNKATAELREMLTAFFRGKWDDLTEAYESLGPIDKCHVMIGLLPYIAPKLSSVEYKEREDGGRTLADELDEISGEKTREG